MPACRFALITLLIFLVGCSTLPQTTIIPTNVVIPTTSLRPPSTLTPIPSSITISTETPLMALTSSPTPAYKPTIIPSPTLIPLATPSLPLNEALQPYADDALLYTRPDRFLMITNSHSHQSLWLTAGICNMVNDSTEQGGQWSVDGRYLAITCNQDQNSDSIRTSILDTQTGKVQLVPLNETLSDSWSPTAPQVLIHQSKGEGVDWYMVDARTGQMTKLLALTDQNTTAVWSHDGTRVAIAGHRSGQQDSVHILNGDGTHLRQLQVDDVPFYYGLNGPVSWSPDGTFLLVNRQLNPTPNHYTYQALQLDVRDGHIQVLVETPNAPLEFQWSPDGAWFIIGQPGQPGSDVGRWSLYRADGTLVHAISTDSQRDDITIRWLPDSQRFIIMAVRLNVGVEIITSDLQSDETVIARYPNNGPGFPALAIAPSGALLAVHLSAQGIAILTIAGEEQALLAGRINAWRPKR